MRFFIFRFILLSCRLWLVPATGETLSASNSVVSYQYTWYDEAGKVLATADYGTNVGTATDNGTYSNGTAPTYDAGTLPDRESPHGEHVIDYGYDDAGRQTKVVHPDGTETHYEYDGLGRQILVTENATAVETQGGTEQRRRAAYFYECADAAEGQSCQGDRLLKIAAVVPNPVGSVSTFSDIDWSAADGTLQVTEFVYGAEVVDQTQGVISAHNGWIAAVHYPDPATGQPIAEPSFAFRYYSDGSVAWRKDAKGNEFAYTYDELGRLEEVGFVSKSAYASGSDTTGRVVFEYSPDGQPTLATVYDASETVVFQNEFDYDGRGNLEAEYQSHTGAVSSGTPYVGYQWQYLAADETHGNFDRLFSITYPARPEQTGPRMLLFSYGAASTIDNDLTRVTAIYDDDLDTNVVSYTYMGGGSRRVITTYGNGVAAERELGDCAKAYDRFGRLRDLDYRNAANSIIQRYQYGYDLAGNRTYARVTQWPSSDTPNHANDRSYLYTYDGLQRLIGSDLGRLNNDNDAITPDAAVALAKSTTWNLDNLGNWSFFYRETDRDGDGTYGESGEGSQYTMHAVDSANQITRHASYGTIAVPLGEDAFLYDLAGNLVYDGTNIYQYDAWNRLVQVNQRGDLEYTPTDPDNDDFDAAGRIDPNPNNNPVHAIGTLVAQYRYDALGRLIVAYEATDLQTPTYQTVHFYYDGVRRIQEVVEQEGDDLTRAEFIYGPDYVDEFIVQTYNDGQGSQVPMYMLQDGNYNVVALLNTSSQVLEQYTWDPYGTLLIKDTQATSAPVNRVGHQSLFWHSLDASETFNAPDPQMDPTPTATGLYYNRNRWYAPHLGRFLQRDSNESATLVIDAVSRNGQVAAGLLNAFDAMSHFGSGMNLYGYTSSNPITGADPLGLFDWFDEADQIQEDRIGNALYTLGTLNESATLGLQTSLQIASVLLGLDVFKSVYVLASGQGGFWTAMDIVMTLNPIGRLGKAAGRIGRAFKWMRRGGHGARAAAGSIDDLYRMVGVWRRGVDKAAEAAAKAKYPKLANKTDQMHHIIPKYLGGKVDGPMVKLNPAYHQEITNAFRTEWRYRSGKKPSMDQLEAILDRVYAKFPLP